MAKKAQKKAKAKAKANAPQRRGGRRMSWSQILVVLAGIMLVIVSMPTVVLLFFGMLPTLVSLIVDRTPQKFAAFCVGGMNFAGVFPSLLDLWMGANSMAMTGAMLTDVFNLAVMYGAAGFGWLLFNAIPPVVGAFLVVVSERRVALLRGQQRRLIEEWGSEVARTGAQE